MSKTGTKKNNGQDELVTGRSALTTNRVDPSSSVAPKSEAAHTKVGRQASRTPKRRTPTPRSSSPVSTPARRKAMSEFEETISSEFGPSRLLQERLLAAVADHHFTPHSAFAIKLALEEAMINAIKHGNKLDGTKHVHVKAKITDTLAEFTIEDEGPGFERQAVPDPTLIENLEKCSGRGIMLIEAYMNSVEWTHRGRRLHMVKRNGEEAG